MKIDSREERSHRNRWNQPREGYRLRKRNNIKPRRRKSLMRRLSEGRKEKRIFAYRSEWHLDIALACWVLRMNNYEIPSDLFAEIIETGRELMQDDSDPKIRLKATELMRRVVRDKHEIDVLEAEKEALKGNHDQKVIVEFSEDFFGNDAHERIAGTDADTECKSEGSPESEDGSA